MNTETKTILSGLMSEMESFGAANAEEVLAHLLLNQNPINPEAIELIAELDGIGILQDHARKAILGAVESRGLVQKRLNNKGCAKFYATTKGLNIGKLLKKRF